MENKSFQGFKNTVLSIFQSSHEQELGPTFVKLGQVLSIRPDVLPPKTMKELARLQENSCACETTEAREVFAKNPMAKWINIHGKQQI